MESEEQQKQKNADLQALDRLAIGFVSDALKQVNEHGECDITAEVTVKITLRLTKGIDE